MKLLIGSEGLITEHNGNELVWNMGVFERTKLPSLEDAFRDINGYWGRLPPHQQTQIFEDYRDIHNTLIDITELFTLTRTLQAQIAKLYEHMSFEHMSHYLKLYGNVSYPDNVRTEYDINDTAKDRTYLKHDYHDLVVMTALLRAMVPVWGEYIRLTKDEVGSTHKEKVAFQLLATSNIINSNPMARLATYIEATVRDSNVSHVSAIMSGIGTEELPEQLLSLVVIRRIAVGEIDSTEIRGSSVSIISNIYKFITNLLDGEERKFGGYRDKKPTGNIDDDEGSIIEEYKLKQAISAGDLAIIEYFALDVSAIVNSIDPSTPTYIVDECLREIPLLMDCTIHPHHIVFSQWVLATAIPPQALNVLERPTVVNAMVATKALLQHWGFTHLALFSTAFLHDVEGMLLGVNEPRRRMPLQLQEKLNALYPYAIGDTGSANKGNPAINAFSKVAKDIASYTWECTVLPCMHGTVDGMLQVDSVLYTPPNILEMLGLLALKLDEVLINLEKLG